MYKVVIIDDEPIIVRGLEKTVKWENWECMVAVTAFNGAEGMGLIRRERPDMLISDICMPEMDGLSMIAALKSEFPDMEIGAGTVIGGEQCERALNAGAKFIVSPGLSGDVALICKQNNVPYYPGCVTPTEIMRALSLGITTVKFFPANVYGGLKAMKALAAPFPQIKFIPTGGVNRENLDEFLSWDKIAAVGGSFFVEEAMQKWAK